MSAEAWNVFIYGGLTLLVFIGAVACVIAYVLGRGRK
jgi:hypothetical protein